MTWTGAQAGLSGQAVNYFAMVPRTRAAVELGFGVGDDGDFVSVTGGSSWLSPGTSDCADCGDWFADPGNPTWLMTLARCCSEGDVRLRTFNATTGSATPDGTRIFAPGQISNYTPDAPSLLRPVIQTMPGERSTARDMVWVGCCDELGRTSLIRSSNPINQSADRRLLNLPAGQWYVQTRITSARGDVRAPWLDITPSDLITSFITDSGVFPDVDGCCRIPFMERGEPQLANSAPEHALIEVAGGW